VDLDNCVEVMVSAAQGRSTGSAGTFVIAAAAGGGIDGSSGSSS